MREKRDRSMVLQVFGLGRKRVETNQQYHSKKGKHRKRIQGKLNGTVRVQRYQKEKCLKYTKKPEPSKASEPTDIKQHKTLQEG